MKVSLEYTFIFDPAELWRTRSAFDSDLSALFKARGMQAEMVESSNKEETKRMVIISKAQDVIPHEKPKSPQGQLKKMKAKRGFDGKFEKSNG